MTRYFFNIIPALLLFTSGQMCFAQKSKTDSLTQLIAKNPEDRKVRRQYYFAIRKLNPDSALIICKDQLAAAEKSGNSITIGDWSYYTGNALDHLQKNEEAKPYYDKAISILKTQRDTFSLDDAQNTYGYLLLRTGEYKPALKNFQEALAFREYTNDTVGKATVLLNMGLLYNNIGDYTQALDLYFKCVAIAELFEEKDPGLMGKLMNNIGSVYMNQKKDEDALKFFRKSIYYKSKADNKKDLASTYNNIGSLYMNSNPDSALYYFDIAMKLREEAGDKRGLGIVHKNKGEVLLSLGKRKEAKQEFELSLKYREEVKDKAGIASSLFALGSMVVEDGSPSSGLSLILRGDSIANAIGSLSHRLQGAIELSKAYRALGKYSDALFHADVALSLKDSLLNDESNRHSEEMRARYDMDQQARELEQLKIEQREIALKSEAQQNFYKLLIVSGIVVLVLIVAFFVIRQRENRKAQQRLQFAFDQIELKNRDITDSIRYAKRIQQAILPVDDAFRLAFPGSFVFYRPKDIVSGDFYWYHQQDDIKLIAVADCTGHGVPGAFMSVLCSSQLTAVSAEQKEVSPATILKRIDDGIRAQLHQDANVGMRDSMDIALCAWNEQTRTLTYAGANRPIILFRKSGDGNFELIKPTKVSVGGDNDTNKQFVEHKITLESGDVFYLFSDGFADQFGGPKGKKFKSNQFRNVLSKIAGHDIIAQGQQLADIFDDWKGQFEQVDDICVIGIRV